MTKEAEPTEPDESDPDEEPTYVPAGKFSLPSAISYPASVSGGVTYGGGGMVMSSGAITASSITSGTIRMSAPPKKRIADAPNKKPKKILVAFLDEDDNQLWAEKLDPGSITVDYPIMGAPKLKLELDLWVDEEEPT